MAKKPAPPPTHRPAAPKAAPTPPKAAPVAAPAVPLRKKLEALPSLSPGRASPAGPKSGVVIVGSLNMDLIARTEVMPLPGQTVMGQDLVQSPGGKGANQAAAAGKLWTKRSAGSRLIGRTGEDLFADQILAALTKAKVDTASVLRSRHAPTGTAMVVVDRHGENAIVVAGGANRLLTATDLLAQRKTIEAAVVLSVQLEIPYDTVACGIALAKRSNVLTILDPAPAPPEGLPESLYHVDILTPNQTEAQLLTGIPVRTADDARRAAERFLLRGTRIVIVKMGSQGAVIVQRPEEQGKVAAAGTVVKHVSGFRVPVLDTTGAGDAFNAALAVGLAEGMPLEQAARFANAAGALTCTKRGALAAMPPRAEVEALLAGTWVKP